MRVLSEGVLTAKKHHDCDACHWFNQSNYGEQDVSADDWLIIQSAFASKQKILPNMEYRKIVYSDGGDLITFKARLDMDKICNKYGLYNEV